MRLQNVNNVRGNLLSYANPAFVNGNSRMRFPVAAKIALHSAGANAGNPGSPIPPGGASLSTMCT